MILQGILRRKAKASLNFIFYFIEEILVELLLERPTQRLWRSILDIYEAILTHPFIRGLTDGSLKEEVFKRYVIQDTIYLRGFAKALASLAARSPEEDWQRIFVEDALGVYEVEKRLHESFFAAWGISRDEIERTPPNPVNAAYVNHLLAIVLSRDFPIGLSAVLPCYWIYLEVGRYLETRGSPKDIYRKWIETYSTGEYVKIVNRVLNIADEALNRISEEEWDEAKEAFRLSSIYEYLFWDAAYRGDSFPFPLRSFHQSYKQ
ncbi:MAG: thiaminase II [Fervidicoccaceae archaeon]